jgi:hypothetical protein
MSRLSHDVTSPAPAPASDAAPSTTAAVIPSDSPFAATAKAPSTVPAAQDGGAAFSFSFALTPPPVEAPTLVPVVPVVAAAAAAAELASSDGKTEPPQRKMRRPRRRKGGTEAEVEAEAEAEEWEGGEEEEWEGGEEDEGAAEEQAEGPVLRSEWLRRCSALDRRGQGRREDFDELAAEAWRAAAWSLAKSFR